jgi:hypothetical protein
LLVATTGRPIQDSNYKRKKDMACLEKNNGHITIETIELRELDLNMIFFLETITSLLLLLVLIYKQGQGGRRHKLTHP